MAAICAVVSRVLLVIAAINISGWWAVGVFLPFGPTFFRLSYPDAARSSFLFRVGTLACIFLYVVLGPGALIASRHKPVSDSKPTRLGYASELVSKIFSVKQPSAKPKRMVSLEERRLENAREFVRLGRWEEALRAKKRDLLKSDVEDTRAYNIDLQEYMGALAAANAEKQALAKSAGK